MKTFAVIITRIALKIFFRVEIVNAGKVPEKGPALLCAVHNNFLDMFFLGFKLKRWINWMAKEELFRNPIIGFMYRSLGAFPVKRGKGDVGSIKQAYKLLNEGEIVGIFPQGTRVKGNNKTIRPKPGAAMLAVNSGVPIIPATVEGSYRLFSRIRVIYGEPFKVENNETGKYSSEELSSVSIDIMNRIYSLLEDEQ